MAIGRLAPRFVSWLDEAIEDFPQAKATAQQWLAGLKKNPRVSMEEVSDKGLDVFLGNKAGPVTRDDIFAHLNTQLKEPMELLPQGDQYQQWSTPGLIDYDEWVAANPAYDPRAGSDHFSMTPGYNYHTRAGDLLDTNLGNVRVLDEVQSDISKQRGNFQLHGNPVPDMSDLEAARDQPWERLYQALDIDSMAGYYPDEGVHHDYERSVEALRELREGLDPAMDDYNWALDQIDQLSDANRALNDYMQIPYNMPAKTRYEWQGMAHELKDAVEEGKDALVWPSSQVQYDRYFKQSPEELGVLAEMTGLQEGVGTRPHNLAAQQYKTAAGSLQMYKNQYDKRMPRDKRWKQLGLEPKLVDLEGKGRYWSVELTPETRERLAKSGIPYYAVGGMAVLGQQEGALEDDDGDS